MKLFRHTDGAKSQMQVYLIIIIVPYASHPPYVACGMNSNFNLINCLEWKTGTLPDWSVVAATIRSLSWPRIFTRGLSSFGSIFLRGICRDVSIIIIWLIIIFQLLWAQTTDVPRTKVSMSVVLAGLFPPVGTSMEWNRKLNWQPIPAESQPLNEDSVLLFERYAVAILWN